MRQLTKSLLKLSKQAKKSLDMTRFFNEVCDDFRFHISDLEKWQDEKIGIGHKSYWDSLRDFRKQFVK